jgi:hypothetical protein
VNWVEVFAVLLVSHLAGDFLLQTEWQAKYKFGGLGRDRLARRALIAHITSYAVAFVPAFVWLGADEGIAVAWVAPVVIAMHLVQDDGRPVVAFIRRAKHSDAGPGDLLFLLVDQSFHVLALFGAALLAVA